MPICVVCGTTSSKPWFFCKRCGVHICRHCGAGFFGIKPCPVCRRKDQIVVVRR